MIIINKSYIGDNADMLIAGLNDYIALLEENIENLEQPLRDRSKEYYISKHNKFIESKVENYEKYKKCVEDRNFRLREYNKVNKANIEKFNFDISSIEDLVKIEEHMITGLKEESLLSFEEYINREVKLYKSNISTCVEHEELISKYKNDIDRVNKLISKLTLDK